MQFIVANWKANKTLNESLEWFKRFGQFFVQQGVLKEVEVVICPSFVVLEGIKNKLTDQNLPFPVKLGAQTVSSHEDGPYTGEVTAKMLSGLVNFCLVGHSETREDMGLTDEKISTAIGNLQKYKIKPILLASKVEQIEAVRPRLEELEANNYAITFEPLGAISKEGAYKASSPADVQKTLADWKQQLDLRCSLLYGGSVNSTNISSFIKQPDIDGVVVGKASLDAVEFARIIQNASQIQT